MRPSDHDLRAGKFDGPLDVVIEDDALDPEFPVEARVRAEVACDSCGTATRSSDHLCTGCRVAIDEESGW